MKTFALLNERLPARCGSAWAAFVLLLWLVSPAAAQWPTPRLAAVHPPGGAVGTTFEVTVFGSELDQLHTLTFNHSGIQATQKQTEPNAAGLTQPINDRFLVSIDPQVPPGIYEATVTGRFGTSNPRRFVVDRLQEVDELNRHAGPSEAQTLTINSVVNGRTEPQQEDFFRIALQAGQQIVIDCQSTSIGSQLLANLKLYNAAGKEIERHRDWREQDPWIPFRATEDMELVIGLHDFLYRGGAPFFYRLRVHEFPHAVLVWPPVVTAGESHEATVVGWNLPSAESLDNWQHAGQTLQQQAVTISPQQLSRSQAISFLQPRASLISEVDFHYPPSTPTASPLPLFVSELPVQAETLQAETHQAEAAADRHEGTEVQPPVELVGRFQDARDVDRWRFTAQAGDVWWIEVLSQSLGCTTDPELAVEQLSSAEDGSVQRKTLVVADDTPNRNGLIGSDFDLSSDDPTVRFQAPADGQYEIVLRDLFSGHADPRNFYRLRLRQPAPDFSVVTRPVLSRPANGNQVIVSSLVLRRGENAELDVIVQRQDGYDGVIRITPQDLPDGVSCPPLVLPPGVSSGPLVFHASREAAAFDGKIALQAVGRRGGEVIERPVQFGTCVWGTGNRTVELPTFRLTSQLTLSVLDHETSPITLKLPAPQDFADYRETEMGPAFVMSKGGSLALPLAVERVPEVQGPFQIQPLGFPPQLAPPPVQVPEGGQAVTVNFPLTNPKLAAGWYIGNLIGDVSWKYNRLAGNVVQAQQFLARVEQKQQQQAALVRELQQSQQQLPARFQQLTQQTEQLTEAIRRASPKPAEFTAQLAELATQEVALTSLLKEDPQNSDTLQRRADVEQQRVALEEQRLARLTERIEQRKALLAKRAEQVEVARRIQTLAGEMAEAEQLAAALVPVQQAAAAALKKAQEANKPIDLVDRMVSPAILIRVVEAPWRMELAPAGGEVGTQLTGQLQLTRDFGFADAVQLAVTLPPELQGASCEPVTLSPEQTTASLTLVTSPETPPGTYQLPVQATATFNQVPVKSQVVWQITLESVATPPSPSN